MKASAPGWMKPILEWFHATMRDLDSLPGSSRTAHSQKAASHRLDRTTRLGWTSHALDRFVERWCPGDRGRAKVVLYDRLAAYRTRAQEPRNRRSKLGPRLAHRASRMRGQGSIEHRANVLPCRAQFVKTTFSIGMCSRSSWLPWRPTRSIACSTSKSTMGGFSVHVGKFV